MDERTFHHVVQVLLGEIEQGLFPVGSTLPSQRELAQRFAVSRDTVQRAMRELVNQGYVEARQGRGTLVLRGPSGSEVRPGRRRVTLSDHVQAAFHSQVVTIDVFTLTGETLDIHLRLCAERMRAGWLQPPESVSMRLLLPRTGGDVGVGEAVDDAEDRRGLDRLRQLTVRHTRSLQACLTDLQVEGLVPSVLFEHRETPVAPMQKLYVFNGLDVLTGYYRVVRRPVLYDTGKESEIYDVLGLGALIHHHSAARGDADPESVAIVDSARRWYEHAWSNATPPSAVG